MRKVFLVLLVLSLSGMFISCSEDEDTVTPTPEPDALEISTGVTLTTGYTCSPYSVQMEAAGGSEPYTWALAAGSTLPTGMELSSDGIITGMMESTGNHNFSIVCTDNESATDEVAFSLGVEVPDNPSIAIFFDEAASVCSGDITFPAALDCYAYIMLDGTEYGWANGASFKINLVNADGTPLTSSQYAYTYTSIPDYALSLGAISNGLAIVFTRPIASTEPVLVCSFGLMLLENLDELAFEIVPNPNDYDAAERTDPIILDVDMVEQNATGRKAAINY